MANETRVTEIDKSDIGSIVELENRVFGAHSYPSFFFRQAYDCWSNSFYVAKTKTQLQGYLLLVPSSKIEGEAWVLSLAVCETARGQGVGKKLISHAIRNSSCYNRLLLTVCPNNLSAVSLYHSFGFEIVNQEDDYFDAGDSRLTLALAV